MRDVLIAGDTVDFVTALPDYPASDGWVLSFRLLPRVSGTAIDITTTASGDDHRASVTAAASASWTAGEYTWQSWVASGAVRYSVADGTCTIKPDPATATAYDGRSQAVVALEAAKAALATFQSSGGRVRSYTIGGRSLEYADEAALLKAISYWQVQVKIEEAANRRKLGLDDGRRVYLRVGNA